MSSNLGKASTDADVDYGCKSCGWRAEERARFNLMELEEGAVYLSRPIKAKSSRDFGWLPAPTNDSRPPRYLRVIEGNAVEFDCPRCPHHQRYAAHRLAYMIEQAEDSGNALEL